MFSRSVRRPYITCQSELELYNEQKTQICPVKEDLKLDYKRIKELNKNFILSDKKYHNFTFYETSVWLCNDDLHIIANEGVYYLMTFVSLGILSVEFNENVGFIKMELTYIFEKNILEKLKERINRESYIDMQKDLNDIKLYFCI